MKLAVFYHGVLSSPICPMEPALPIMIEQMAALQHSGLADAADEIYIGINNSDALLASAIVPKKSHLILTGDGSRGEYPTIAALQQWLPGHSGWKVCYHHIKGASNGSDQSTRWRHCMERCVIANWQSCVEELGCGRDTVGVHWYKYLDQRYWAGNFWWANADYLLSLPVIPDKIVNGRSYEAEVWIGNGKGTYSPRIRDYARHAVMKECR